MLRDRTLSAISRFFKEQIWRSKFLLMAQTNPAIWHAMMSLSSYHLLYLRRMHYPGFEKTRDFHELSIRALTQYNAAIRAVMRSQESPQYKLSKLMSCVVFVIIEMLRDDVAKALILLRLGINILRHIEQELAEGNLPASDALLAIIALAKLLFDWLYEEVLRVSQIIGVDLLQ
ncbi:hypothetical protein E4U43_004957 [Claviceps pusilla]|uniref:Uncharacterized protein n=1 Tax=Claviceps pusilla TaxID=123648 RepID=A0A9P7STM5_9HYPO|nr:hypothetical protein E4U43_004957 [Claviceps pusilla]